ncbi:MAG: cobyric acid synthase CobQ, partial [Candidatus Bipolaricaulia bacterium]
STIVDQVRHPLGEGSAATDRVLGTYIHGLFENEPPRAKFVDNLFSHSGKERPEKSARSGMFYDGVADLVENNLDLEWLYG